MTLQSITPQDAAKMLEQGAVLVDIREADEHRRAKIPGALSVPLSELDRSHLPKDAQAIVFHCKSGMRTQSNAAKLKEKAGCDAYVLEGGFDNWTRQGLPAHVDKSSRWKSCGKCKSAQARWCWQALFWARWCRRAFMRFQDLLARACCLLARPASAGWRAFWLLRHGTGQLPERVGAKHFRFAPKTGKPAA